MWSGHGKGKKENRANRYFDQLSQVIDMRAILQRAMAKLLLGLLRLRYSFEVRGLEEIAQEAKKRKSGILFLSTHPSMTDPISTFTLLWPYFQPRPIATEHVYNMPGVHRLLRWIRGVPVPNFKTTGNTFKRQRGEKTFRRIQQGLKQGDNFVIHPAGRLKLTGFEAMGGASWAHRLISEVPDVDIVMIRYSGLWGSSFSRAITGKSPLFWPTIANAFKMVFKNAFFFSPKRKIVVEFFAPGKAFPKKTSRVELNRYLENWFNFGDKELAPEPLNLVSTSRWQHEFPEVAPSYQQDETLIDLKRIPPEVKKAVIDELVRMTKLPERTLTPEKELGKDLGLDSLDAAEIIVFLDDRFSIQGVRPQDLTNIGQLMALAAGQIDLQSTAVEDEGDEIAAGWHKKGSRPPILAPEGRTIQEAFLKSCDRLNHAVACADRTTGCLTYRQLKMRVLLLANELRHLPGERVGIMLPASVGVTTVILACLLAGKTPVMINWTVGSRHLESCVAQAEIHVILSSQKFIDELEGVELKAIAPLFYMLEDLRERLGVRHKIKAFVESFRTADALLDEWNGWQCTEDDTAVVLFTSGTESHPKGVPLSHRNILSNIRACFAVLPLLSKDVLYGILPPFHSFGFTVTGLLPILLGLKVVYSPNPTDSIRLARGISTWGITLICSAPTFIKGILHVASSEQLKTIRLFISGAEKAPAELFKEVSELGAGHQIIEGYGITECSPVLACVRPGKAQRGVGQALPNVEVKIVDIETNAPKSQGEEGMIAVRGPNVFSGYLQSTQNSPFVTLDDDEWYLTGDLGHFDTEGNLLLSGRLKRFVKMGGEMISLSAIEEVLTLSLAKWELDGESKAPLLAIATREEEGKKPELILATPLELRLEDINRALREAGLSNLARISAIVQIDSIPQTGTGKVAYRALSELVAVQLSKI